MKRFAPTFAQLQRMPVIDEHSSEDDGHNVNELLAAALYLLAANVSRVANDKQRMCVDLRATAMQLRLVADECDRVAPGCPEPVVDAEE